MTTAIPALEIDAVRKRFGAFEALKGVSLQIAQGEFFGLLGPNGAGKTTLITTVAGLTRPDSGRVRVMGHDVASEFRAARRALGVVPQELVFDPFFSVRETLRLTSGYYGLRPDDDWIDEILANLDLLGKADANTRTLSGGMKRRVLIGQALVHRPPVIILDEPTAGVDVELRHALWRFIRRLNEQGHTIVLTTHYLEEAQQLCSRIAMLKQGRVVALDRTDRLIQGQTGGTTLVLRLSGAPLPEALADRRVELQGERGEGGDRVGLRLATPAELEGVLATLREAGCQIDELELQPIDLEDVFVNLMREAS